MRVRSLFFKNLSAIYAVSFMSFVIQYPGLYSKNGILPIQAVLELNREMLSKKSWWDFPTIFMLLPSISIYQDLESFLSIDSLYILSAFIGVCLGCLAFTLQDHDPKNYALQLIHTIISAVLYLIYLSLYKVGQTFMSFQWDIFLLEIGFLAILYSACSIKISESRCVVWSIRFLLFKFMLMNGIVKV